MRFDERGTNNEELRDAKHCKRECNKQLSAKPPLDPALTHTHTRYSMNASDFTP